MRDGPRRAFALPPSTPIASWSNIAKTETRRLPFSDALRSRQDWMAGGFIPHGAGHSWGDAAFLSGGITLSSHLLRTIEPLDEAASTVTAEAGVTMAELHAFLEAADFRFPVYGGTQGVTLAGAAAADIHGKNHRQAGSFGEHVVSIELLTASGASLHCSREVNGRLFAATIGGMGLTGFITRLTLRVARGKAPCVRAWVRSVGSIAEMLDSLETPSAEFGIGDWVEPARPGSRGVVTLAGATDREEARRAPRPPFKLPLPRINAFNNFTVRLIDFALHRLFAGREFIFHMRRFNNGGPHEAFVEWNKLFGPRGLIEYHCAIPKAAIMEVWTMLCRGPAGRAPLPRFAVVKRFGPNRSPGLLSFPIEGYSLNFRIVETPETRTWLTELGWLIVHLGGRIYLAKDAIATADQIEASYPQLNAWRSIVRECDPHGVIRSDLSNRLKLKPW